MKKIIIITLLICQNLFSQDISKKELYGVWLAEEVELNSDLFPSDDSGKTDIIKKGFLHSKYSFSKSGVFKIEMDENAPEPFNDEMFSRSFYWDLNFNIVEIGQQKKGKNIMNIGVVIKDNSYYFNLVGVLLKVKKIKESVKLKKPTKPKRNAYSTLPSKLLVNETINEENIVDFKAVDKIPITMDCHLKYENEALKECVSKSINSHIGRKFNLDLPLSKGLSGKIKINNTFIVNTEGVIVNITSDSKDQDINNEAKRVINLLPKMIPGKHNNTLINVRLELPITFNIAN